MKMAKANTPLVMRSMSVLHPAPFEDFPVRDPPLLGTACCPQASVLCSHCPFPFSLEVKAPASNKTEDQVKHLLLVKSPALHPPTPQLPPALVWGLLGCSELVGAPDLLHYLSG